MTKRPATEAIRAGIERTQHQETAEGLFLTSGYVYGTAAEAEQAFAGTADRYMYTRFGNPTVTAFAERLRAIEGAQACFPTASGMAAVFTALLAVTREGARVVSSRQLFGSCYTVLADILPRFGVRTEFVDGTSLSAWEQALSTPAAAVFFESPANPLQQLVDVAGVSELAHAAGAMVIADNAMAGPSVQNPTAYGADVVVYSTTKHIDGQGRTLGGAILGPRDLIEGEIKTLIRNVGPTMSPFNAWVALKGLETLRIRVDAMQANAVAVAGLLQEHRRVNWVRYPGLPSHPQHDLATRQMRGGGTIVAFEIDGGKEAAFRFVDGLELFVISNNFGDAKSMVTHPATTTHYRIGEDARARAGITDGVVRLSLGLEDPADLLADVEQALR